MKIIPSPSFIVLNEVATVPFLAGTSRTIDAQKAKLLLCKLKAASRRGCYIFAIRNGKRRTPWYVGKAAKQTFAKEVFTDHKCRIYCEALGLKSSGTPEVIFVAAPQQQGAPNKKAIDRLETHLINEFALANPNLRNRRKTEIYKLVIAGVMNAGSGKRSNMAKVVHKMLGRD